MSKVKIIGVDAGDFRHCGFCGYGEGQEGYECKLSWIERRFAEGMRYKLLVPESGGAAGFIEYMPGEYAWRAVDAPGYMVIHCIANFDRRNREKGHGRLLLEEALRDAAAESMRGVVAITHRRGWLPRNEFFLKNGFEIVDSSPPDYELLVRKFGDPPSPRFRAAENLERYGSGLMLLYSNQCPYVIDSVGEIAAAASERGVEIEIIELKSGRDAQKAGSPFAIFDLVYNGRLLADHPVSAGTFAGILEREVM
jgi:GNAT superfamily N-acetyltransferase